MRVIIPLLVDKIKIEAFKVLFNRPKLFKDIWCFLEGVEIRRIDLKNGVFR
jgi:hypothetical protein